jgi:hypothetical protein
MVQPRAERLMNLHILLLGAKRFIGKDGAKWKIAQILSTQLITSPIQNASKSLH